MKTIFQIKNYLICSQVASKAHFDMIVSFCLRNVAGSSEKQFSKVQVSNNGGVTSSLFIEWYESGYGIGDWGILNGKNFIVFSADSNKCDVRIFQNNNDWRIFEDISIKQTKNTYTDNWGNLDRKLKLAGIDFVDGVFKPFKLPKPDDKVILQNREETLVGVISSADQSLLQLHCFYSYTEDFCNYSGNFTTDPYSWSIRPATIGELRRLNRELNTCGKIWNDRLKRVESATPKAKPGERYWYIDDKMNMICKVEENKPTSHFRYLAGNYFLSPTDCLKVLGQFNEILKQKMRE